MRMLEPGTHCVVVHCRDGLVGCFPVGTRVVVIRPHRFCEGTYLVGRGDEAYWGVREQLLPVDFNVVEEDVL